VVVDAAGPEGFGFPCFGGGGCCSRSAVAPAPFIVVGASGMEPAQGGSGDSSSSMSGRFSGSYSGIADGGNLPTSLIAPIGHLMRFGIAERKESCTVPYGTVPYDIHRNQCRYRYRTVPYVTVLYRTAR
jgi:hypothetical protein